MNLTQAAIQKHRVQIPRSIQKIGSAKDLECRLRSTFDLLGKSSSLSSKAIEGELNDIRSDLTPSFGKSHESGATKP